LGGETRIVEKFKLILTCRGIDLLGLKVICKLYQHPRNKTALQFFLYHSFTLK